MPGTLFSAGMTFHYGRHHPLAAAAGPKTASPPGAVTKKSGRFIIQDAH
jgi:hypothetical protein